ncbi:hypothetical protein PVAND_010298 [Polypedilum vanderplanki]|uniref:Uncharacterized protein n=1 Tax=Polypedilum vanderplanki TaxID=319348 RepID=A0A9J6CFU9_POLVA|nr:hypothetical protein PVAND_010298 [Polypedilum vanderplanki]
MFRYSAVLILALLPVAYNQLISFKDGKIGVNFLGYHAEAGLGGLLSGNAAHGGLQASAGTPFGQRAAAGLGGSVDEAGRPRGGGFAAASAGSGIGASAALGGNVNEYGASGGHGSEAHGAGYSAKKVELSAFPQGPQIPPNVKSVEIGPLNSRSSFQEDAPQVPQYPKKAYGKKYNGQNVQNAPPQYDDYDNTPAVAPLGPQQAPPQQDYRNFFDFGYFSNLGATISGAPNPQTQSGNAINLRRNKGPNSVLLEKYVRAADETGAPTTITKRVHVQRNPNFFNDIFNIPISTLTAVNQFLNNGFNGGR